jgi:hypothetical protein
VSKRAADVAEELKRAQEQLSLVSIDRRDFDDVEGYIVGLGDEWLLMALAAVTANAGSASLPAWRGRRQSPLPT